MFEPLAQRKKVTLVEYEKRDKNIEKLESYSALNFKCTYAYGFTIEEARQSLFYVHHYPKTMAPHTPLSFTEQCNLGKQKSREIEYTTRQLLPLN
jgi:hypothetical protein